MAPKKTETKSGGAGPKSKTASHGSYQAMITDAIVALKDRNGSSRQSLKKYVRANNNILVSDKMFDSLFNKALKNGVEKGVFEQPKGASGGTKLAKKAPKAAAPKKAAPKKETVAKKDTKDKKASAPSRKTAVKQAPKEKKPAAPKKKAAPKKTTAPAVVDKPTVLTKTKSGRVAKTSAPKKPPTKAAPKKATKKAEAAAA